MSPASRSQFLPVSGQRARCAISWLTYEVLPTSAVILLEQRRPRVNIAERTTLAPRDFKAHGHVTQAVLADIVEITESLHRPTLSDVMAAFPYPSPATSVSPWASDEQSITVPPNR